MAFEATYAKLANLKDFGDICRVFEWNFMN